MTLSTVAFQVGPHGAKVRLELLADPAYTRRGKLILVTATSPTVSGEGKTVTAIGLTQGLALLGKKSVITSREPSLGPVFGMKGGRTGRFLSKLEPSAKINLHFHGDFHAISSAQFTSQRSSTPISSTATIYISTPSNQGNILFAAYPGRLVRGEEVMHDFSQGGAGS